ncbi:hypothetical protein [Belnapia sp. F-4-1]|uniref:hypothetical protein n=1 Tax=Belnapia sp. F-4-1 TaxID=1545443 RepID=UPI0005BA9842|nr:hypothetical protein [Belnapia sp. F-4-1]
MSGTIHRRVAVLERQACSTSSTVYVFQMPGEDTEAAITRCLGPAGAPPGAAVVVFTWLPTQPAPERGTIQ